MCRKWPEPWHLINICCKPSYNQMLASENPDNPYTTPEIRQKSDLERSTHQKYICLLKENVKRTLKMSSRNPPKIVKNPQPDAKVFFLCSQVPMDRSMAPRMQKWRHQASQLTGFGSNKIRLRMTIIWKNGIEINMQTLTKQHACQQKISEINHTSKT